MHKVYITGMGAVSSLGMGANQMFNGLLENRSGIKSFPEWKQYKGLNCFLGAPAPDFDNTIISRNARRTMSRMSEMAVIATQEACKQANYEIQPHQHNPRVAFCMGSTTGSPENLEQHFRKLIERGGPEGQLGTTFFKVMNHSVVSNVASALGFYGAALGPSSACATSAQAMILGWELLQTGLYDMVIAGGADELHYTGVAVFDTVMAASRGYNDRPEMASRPFDSARDGLVVSEGAGIVILETEDNAKKRGAKPLAQFNGGMYTCDGSHMSQTQNESMSATIQGALERSGLNSTDINYVNAHATATLQGDPEEAKAISAVFDKHAAVSSLKGHMGHSLAACGALEVIACVKMIESNTLIPTRNLVTPAQDCAQIRHVQGLEKLKVNHILSNNFAFGGINSSLLLSSLQ